MKNFPDFIHANELISIKSLPAVNLEGFFQIFKLFFVEIIITIVLLMTFFPRRPPSVLLETPFTLIGDPLIFSYEPEHFAFNPKKTIVIRD